MSQPDSTQARRPGIPPLLLVGLYGLLALTPLLLAWLQGLPARSFWRELSSGLVLVGFAMLLAQFLLSGRFRSLSGRVGIDLVMRFHQLIAFSLLVFILVHPLLYAVPRLADGPDAALTSLVRMFSSRGLRSGVIAWVLLLLLVPLGIFRDRLPLPYETWRLSHGLGAAAIAVLSTHHTLRVGTYSDNPWLAGFWLILTGLALLSLVQVYLIKPLAQRGTPWRVIGNRPVAERMWEIRLEPEDGKAPPFEAGQFAWLNLGHSAFSLTEHPFSISSAPAERPQIAFTIKESGDFTRQIGSISVGTRAYLDGPHGTFCLHGRPQRPLVLIAGGVGFAPIIGMLRQLARDSWPHPVHLIYGNRHEGQILYREEIEALRSRLDLRVDLVLSEPPPDWPGPQGELTPDMLDRCLPHPSPDALYFLCGPLGMMDSVEAWLSDRQVPNSAVVAERFKYS